MTHPILGRAVPVHFMMTDLAGWGFSGPEAQWRSFEARDNWGFLDREAALSHLHSGRAELVGYTGSDFGFELAAWRRFLIRASEQDKDPFGYGHAYAASRVDKLVCEAIARPDRGALEDAAKTGWEDYVFSLPQAQQEKLTRPTDRRDTPSISNTETGQ